MSELAFQGEPWFTQANVYSFPLKAALIFVLIWYLGPQSERLSAEAILWIEVHQYLALTTGILCLVLALLGGAVRQVLIRMMSTALAIPMQDSSGTIFLGYMGDVPAPGWQYSPWPRFLSWVFVAVASLIFAFLGAHLASLWFGADSTTIFWILLVSR